MSFDFPANIQQDIQQYAQEERISSEEALLKLVQTGLKATKRKAVKNEITEANLRTLRENVPIFAFLENLPDGVVDAMEETSKQIRTERFVPRG